MVGEIRFFDLFAGVGGFRLGFEREGYARELGIPDTHLYKITGNAVTVQIPQSIARKLKNVIDWEG